MRRPIDIIPPPVSEKAVLVGHAESVWIETEEPLSAERAREVLAAAPSVRLDLPEDQRRLRDTVAILRPTLLVLDPFVRLHRIDENASG